MSPHRRPLRRDELGVDATLGDFRDLAKIVELGWTQAREKLRDAGWPERQPRQRTTPRITIRCGSCGEELHGSAAKDEHRRDTGHTRYTYTPPAPIEPSSIDYADPTGDLAPTLDRTHDDVLEMQDLWVKVVKSYRELVDLTRSYVPTAWHGEEPACWYHAECGSPVEKTDHGGYRGMERIAGLWVTKPGTRPVCAMHRTRERRAS